MTLEEILRLVDQGVPVRFARDQFTEKDGICVTKGLIPLPLIALAGFYRGDPATGIFEIDIYNEANQSLGVLCLCQDMGEVDIGRITDAQYAAYIYEVGSARFGLPFRFNRDYVVLDVQKHDDYVNRYMRSSTIWGGILHDVPNANLPPAYSKLPASIIALPGIAYPTTHHEENAMRSVSQPYAFERFLKLYHSFELLFDYDVVKRIQGLGDDLLGIGGILQDYKRTELDRLKATMKVRCPDTNRISACLNQIALDPDFIDRGKAIFFKYGKDGNPFSDENQFESLVNMGFSHPNAHACKINQIRPADPATYDQFVINCAAYWTYRIRSSIAHSRIGEYVMTVADEKFVVEVAEPLLRELLCQALTP